MKFIPKIVTQKVGRSILQTKHHSPTILFGLGIIGVGATVVMACRATLRVEEIVDDTKSDVEKAQINAQSAKDEKRMILEARAIGARRIVSLYAPTAVVAVVSIAALAGSRHILNKRNAALSAAYSAVSTTLREYRKRVSDHVGEEQEHLLYHNAEIERDEQGKILKSGKASYPDSRDPYTLVYSRDNIPDYKGDPELNLIQAEAFEHFAGKKLIAQGHLFLNEVYDILGVPHTHAGSKIGWLVDGNGDGYVDFGIHRDGVAVKRYLTGKDSALILTFNCDPDTINEALA